MQSKVVLISDDADFFEYITPKLSLRKSDELFKFDFDSVPEKSHLLASSLLIVNSENKQTQTLELLDMVKSVPIIVFSYNEDSDFKVEAYKRGMFAYFTPSSTDAEISAQMIPALKLLSSIQKNNMYRDMLVRNNLITKNNEVFLDFTTILDKELDNIHKNSAVATLFAISPDEKSKFIVQPNQIETVILNNIRENDILMNYASNKYFLLLHNTDKSKSELIWKKLNKNLPDGIYAGFASIGQKSRQQVINEALNKLHEAMNKNAISNSCNIYSGNNFKFFRQEFNKKLEQVISPTFYHVQQMYGNIIPNIHFEEGLGEGYGVLYVTVNDLKGTFRITSPGLSSINIDISYENINKDKNENDESKRIVLEPEELEEGLLHDLLEQFIIEFKNVVK